MGFIHVEVKYNVNTLKLHKQCGEYTGQTFFRVYHTLIFKECTITGIKT